MEKQPINIGEASRIVIPSGRDYQRSLEAFEAEYGVTAPRFEDRRLILESDGKQYIKVKGKDVPSYVAEGFADIGLTGTDVCEEQIPEGSNVSFAAIGEAMCTFNLLVPEVTADDLVARLSNPEADPLSVATSYPRFLARCIKRWAQKGDVLNIAVSSFKPAGSVEVIPALGVADAVADLVETGETAVVNGLRIGPKLADVLPAVVWRNQNERPRPLTVAYTVDSTLDTRIQQVNNSELSSYTLERLRDPNKAVKDYGEESAEFLDAAIRGSSSAANELADLVFAGLVLSRANGGNVRLEEIVRILEERSANSSLTSDN